MISQFFLILTLAAFPLQGLDTEVEYIHSNLTAAVGDSVTLYCGSPPPHTFIWDFTKPGSENVAVAYDYGHGPIVPTLSSDLGQRSVPESTSSLQIEDVQADAEGTFTCQALYDEEQELRVTFYSTKLVLE